MPSTRTLPRPASHTGIDNELHHVVTCYSDDVALCGLDVKDLSWATEDEETNCIVCLDLEDTEPCICCGGCPECE